MKAGWSPSIFQAVILGNFLLIQRLGMWLSICQLNIYYKPIYQPWTTDPMTGPPQTFFLYILTVRARLKTCKEELKGSSFLKDHLIQLFGFAFGETETQREKQPCSKSQSTLVFIFDLLAFKPPEQTNTTGVKTPQATLRDVTVTYPPVPHQVQAEIMARGHSFATGVFCKVLRTPSLCDHTYLTERLEGLQETP